MGSACGEYGWGEGCEPLGRPRRRWVDNIRMDLQEVGCGYMDWIGLAQDRDRCRTLVSAVMTLRVPWNAGNFLTSCKPVSFSRRTLHHGVSKWYISINHWKHNGDASPKNSWNSATSLQPCPGSNRKPPLLTLKCLTDRIPLRRISECPIPLPKLSLKDSARHSTIKAGQKYIYCRYNNRLVACSPSKPHSRQT